MLSAIRAFAKSPYAAVLIALLIVSFAVFGIRDMFHAKITDSVVTAGSRLVTSAEYKRAFDAFKGQVEQQVGQPITPELAAANGLDRRVLEGLATREAYADLLTTMGIRPADKLIAAEIQKIPAFFDQVSGRFDKIAYQRKLADNNMTPTAFERTVRDQISDQQATTGLITGFRVPLAYAAMAGVYAQESRDMAFFGVEPGSVPAPAAPTDEQLNQLMKENAAQLTRPEFRQVTVVQFTPAQVAANAPIDPKELQKRFDFRKDTLSSPETRTVVQIAAKDPAAALKIAQGLAKGADPELVAKSVGVSAITFANKPQTAIPDRKVAAAAFATPSGQVATVRGDLGPAVIKVMSVTPGRAVTLEEVRPVLEAEIRKDQASEKVYALTQAYDDAHQGGANLQAAAAKAGVPTMSMGPFAQNGRDMQGQPVPGLTPKIAQTAWTLAAGSESELEDAGGGGFYAVRVEKIIPATLPPFAEIRPKLAQAWTQRELAKAMQARADSLAARIKKGETLEAVAASAGSSVTRAPGLSRQTVQQNPTLSQDMVAKVFTSRPGEAFTAQSNHFGFVVGKLEAIHVGEPEMVARTAEQIRGQMSSAFYREINESAHVAARRTVKVTIDANRARQAIGLEPIDPKASDSKVGAKPVTAGKAPLAK